MPRTRRMRAAVYERAGRGVDRIVEVDLAANVTTDLAALRPEGDVVLDT